MQYPGGKKRAIKGICQAIQKTGAAGPFWEPFCGGLGASVGLTEFFGVGLHSDSNIALITMYQAFQDGWVPPDSVTELEYHAAKRLPDSDPLKAFCAVACSYAGKWFGGYARDPNGTRNRDGVPCNFALSGRAALARDVPKISRPFYCSFFQAQPMPGLGFLYCDPPYAGCLGYSGTAPFNSTEFWLHAELWSAHCPVFVSEYTAPAGWREIWSAPQQVTVQRTRGKFAVERLFIRG